MLARFHRPRSVRDRHAKVTSQFPFNELNGSGDVPRIVEYYSNVCSGFCAKTA